MKVRIISKSNKVLNSVSTLILLLLIVIFILSSLIDSENFLHKYIEIIAFSLISIAILSIILGLVVSKKIHVNMFEIQALLINTFYRQDEIGYKKQINYLGNRLTMADGKKHEIHRASTFELLKKHKENNFSINMVHKRYNFYHHSPLENLEFIANFFV